VYRTDEPMDVLFKISLAEIIICLCLDVLLQTALPALTL